MLFSQDPLHKGALKKQNKINKQTNEQKISRSNAKRTLQLFQFYEGALKNKTKQNKQMNTKFPGLMQKGPLQLFQSYEGVLKKQNKIEQTNKKD